MGRVCVINEKTKIMMLITRVKKIIENSGAQQTTKVRTSYSSFIISLVGSFL